jgi:RHS repeat-associated protein
VTGASTANFYYDADGKQVKTVVNGVTTYYVGNHYEVKNSVVTKYYFAGTTRLAVRTNGTLSYLLSDHIGSSSVTTDANGVKTASALYKAFGETRFSAGNLGTDYKFTGQREEASLGIYFFNARWFDPSLGRFTSPDTIVPTSTQGTQAWDRYAFVNNNPVRYNDPTGHTEHDNTGVTCEDTNANNTGAKGQCTYDKPDELPLCSTDITYEWCNERTLNETQAGEIEQNLSNTAFAEGGLATGELVLAAGLFIAVAAVVVFAPAALILGVGAAVVLGVAGGVAAAAGAVQALEWNQTQDMATYMSGATQYAHDNGTVNVAYYKQPGQIPAVYRQNAPGGLAQGVTSILSYLNMEHYFP